MYVCSIVIIAYYFYICMFVRLFSVCVYNVRLHLIYACICICILIAVYNVYLYLVCINFYVYTIVPRHQQPAV